MRFSELQALVRQGSEERAAQDEESKGDTRAEYLAVGKIKDWEREVRPFAKRMQRSGFTVPGALLESAGDVSPGQRQERTLRTAALLEALELDAEDKVRAGELAAEGRVLAAELEASNARQESGIERLPEGTAAHRRAKGELYVAIKMVNDAAKEVHARHPERWAPYNLNILYRQRSRPAKKSEGQPGQTAEGQQPPEPEAGASPA